MMRKRILFLANHLQGGGIEQILFNVLQLISSNYHIQVLTIYDSQSVYSDRIKQITTISTLDFYRNSLRNRFLKSIYSRIYDNIFIQNLLLKRYLKKHQADDIIAFSDGRAVDLIAKQNKYNKIAWVHTDFIQNEIEPNLIKLSRLYQSFNKVFFVSQALKKKYTAFLRLTNTYYIPNTINKEIIQKNSTEGQSYIKRKQGVIECVAIGRLSPEKGFDRIINSIGKLPACLHKRIHLTIIGGGYEKSNLIRLCNSYDISSIVTFTNFQPNPYPTLKDADFLIVPSRFEGFGLVVLEAMSLNIPVIATRTTGPTEILNHGEFGTLVENEDNAFDNIIKKVILEPELFQTDDSKMQERVASYNNNTIKEKLLTVL